MSARAAEFVRSIRGEARPAAMCGRCGALLAAEARCDVHPSEAPCSLRGEWLEDRAEVERYARPVSDDAKLISILSAMLGVLLLFTSPFMGAPKAALIAGAVFLALAVFVPMFSARRRTRRRDPRREWPKLPEVDSVAGVVQRLDEDDAWLGYHVTAEPVAGLTASDGWVEPLVLELDDGRTVTVPAGPARIVGGTERELDAGKMHAIRGLWLEQTDLEPDDARALGSGGGVARVLVAGGRVRLFSRLEEAEAHDGGYRAGARYVALPPIVIALADNGPE